jgi:hypothetical protein
VSPTSNPASDNRRPHTHLLVFPPRRSTITPIRVAHEFSLQVFFSIWGEDAHGEKLAKNGPGHMRKFTTLQSTLIMSVSSPGVDVSIERSC